MGQWSGIGCSVRGSLQTADGRQVNSGFEGQVVPGENLFTGVESGYTVSSGEYVLDISSDCVWSVTFRRLVPEPRCVAARVRIVTDWRLVDAI